MTVALETIRSLRAVTPQNTIIEAQHVGQRFTADNGTELTVFDNISFNLYEGEIVAILGRSGAGKSTFLRALAGLVKPTSGTVKYRGKALTGPNPGIAMNHQHKLHQSERTRCQHQYCEYHVKRAAACGTHQTGSGCHRHDRPGRLRIGVSEGTVWRHEAARGHCTRLGAAAGRAVHG